MPPHAMKCGQALPPESLLSTKHGASEITIFGHAVYRGLADDGRHAWRYEVELQNNGRDTVQLMSRHMVSTTADGSVDEVKGAGARGRLPLLRPGEHFETTGTTLLRTAFGSLHGSFQFEKMLESDGDGGGDGGGDAFSANMGRFLLPPGRQAAQVPCSPEADVLARELPPTSVFNSYRVLAAATVEYMPDLSDSDTRQFVFMYDVQIHNGRSKAPDSLIPAPIPTPTSVFIPSPSTVPFPFPFPFSIPIHPHRIPTPPLIPIMHRPPSPPRPHAPSPTASRPHPHIVPFPILSRFPSQSIALHWREWSFLDARGVQHSDAGVGLGGLKQTGKVRLEAGQALRYQARHIMAPCPDSQHPACRVRSPIFTLRPPHLHTPASHNISLPHPTPASHILPPTPTCYTPHQPSSLPWTTQGVFELPTPTGIAAARYAVALDESDPDQTTYEVVVAPLGVSTDGGESDILSLDARPCHPLSFHFHVSVAPLAASLMCYSTDGRCPRGVSYGRQRAHSSHPPHPATGPVSPIEPISFLTAVAA